MRVIQLTSAVAAITLIALAGACSSPVAHVAGDAAPVTGPASPVATTATPSPTVPTVAASVQPSKVEPAKTVTKKTNPCPVTSSTLYRVIKGTDFGDRLGNPPGLKVQKCYQGYAVAEVVEPPDSQQDINVVLFKYNAGTGRWEPLNFGSGGVCEGYVSADVESHIGGTGC